MAYTKDDKTFLEGWSEGYKHAIDDIRQDLLVLEHDARTPLPLEVYEILNYQAKKLEEI